MRAKARAKPGTLAVLRLALALAILGGPGLHGTRPASAAAIGSAIAPPSDDAVLRQIYCAVADGLRLASASIVRRLGRSGWGAEVSVSLAVSTGGETGPAAVGGASRSEQVTFLQTARDLLGGRTFRGCTLSLAKGAGRTIDARRIATSVSTWAKDAFGTMGGAYLRPGASDVLMFEMQFFASMGGETHRTQVLPFGPAPPPDTMAWPGSLSMAIGRLDRGK